MDQERLNFAWQGNFARNWPQALTVLRPVKRSRSTYYDGPRLSSFMLWVWCGSSHKTPGCTLVCITLVLGCWQGSFVVGCVRSTTCSEVPATWVLRRCGVGGPAILRVSIWRRFRAETLHPLQSFDISPLIGSWISSFKGRCIFFMFFSYVKRGNIHLICNTFLFICYLPRERNFTQHSITPPAYCPLVTGTSYIF